MVMSDVQDLGSLLSIFHKKKKKAAPVVVPASTNFNFPAPIQSILTDPSKIMGGPPPSFAPGKPASGKSAASPSGPSTIAPTGVMDYLPWIIGGGVAVTGVLVLLIMKRRGKL